VTDGPDKSHGYEALAETFMRIRNRRIGPAVIREWCRTLPPGATVLDLGCGFGVITEVLVGAEFRVFAVDASAAMIRALRERFPEVEAECAAAEESAFFGRQFDGIVAWGLLFLLPAETQEIVIQKSAGALQPGGRFVFTAPREAQRWKDAMTEEESVSLGRDKYLDLLAGGGLTVVDEREDEGENHYYFCVKQAP